MEPFDELFPRAADIDWTFISEEESPKLLDKLAKLLFDGEKDCAFEEESLSEFIELSRPLEKFELNEFPFELPLAFMLPVVVRELCKLPSEFELLLLADVVDEVR